MMGDSREPLTIATIKSGGALVKVLLLTRMSGLFDGNGQSGVARVAESTNNQPIAMLDNLLAS
jgi:hypothetical protein